MACGTWPPVRRARHRTANTPSSLPRRRQDLPQALRSGHGWRRKRCWRRRRRPGWRRTVHGGEERLGISDEGLEQLLVAGARALHDRGGQRQPCAAARVAGARGGPAEHARENADRPTKSTRHGETLGRAGSSPIETSPIVVPEARAKQPEAACSCAPPKRKRMAPSVRSVRITEASAEPSARNMPQRDCAHVLVLAVGRCVPQSPRRPRSSGRCAPGVRCQQTVGA